MFGNCCAPSRVYPENLSYKRRQILECLDDEVFVDEIYDYLTDKKQQRDERKKKSKFRFKALGRLIGLGKRAPSEEKVEEPRVVRKRRTFKAVGKAAQMGIKGKGASKKPCSIEEDPPAEIKQPPPKKKWTFRSLGKTARLSTAAKPRLKRTREKWTFKALANFIRYGPGSLADHEMNKPPVEDTNKKKWTLKSLGKLSKIGGFKNESVEKPKQKFTIKSLGKLSKLGFGKDKQNAATQTSVKRRKTLKSFGKASIVGAAVTKRNAKQKMNKGNQKWTFKNLGNISRLGISISSNKPRDPNKPKRKWTFKSLTRAAQVGVSVGKPVKKMKPKRKNPFSFKFMARFTQVAKPKNKGADCTCTDVVCICKELETYECTCSSDEA